MSKQLQHLVLCIDDERIGLKVRQILLERAGYRVITAESGAAGLEIFSQEPVNAVVLDYSMPGMHGGEVARRMRDDKPSVPILLLSAYVDIPPEITDLVSVSMTKGEGAVKLLEKLGSLISACAGVSTSPPIVPREGSSLDEPTPVPYAYRTGLSGTRSGFGCSRDCTRDPNQ